MDRPDISDYVLRTPLTDYHDALEEYANWLEDRLEEIKLKELGITKS